MGLPAAVRTPLHTRPARDDSRVRAGSDAPRPRATLLSKLHPLLFVQVQVGRGVWAPGHPRWRRPLVHLIVRPGNLIRVPAQRGIQSFACGAACSCPSTPRRGSRLAEGARRDPPPSPHAASNSAGLAVVSAKRRSFGDPPPAIEQPQCRLLVLPRNRRRAALGVEPVGLYSSQRNTTDGDERSTGPWYTASTLVPSGSRTKAP